ncbi:alpha/beta hydrolase [Desulfolithobacter sp.]
MTANPLDSPEILNILFHPRTCEKTPIPPGATDIPVKMDDEATIGCRLFSAGLEAPTILFFHGNGEIVADYDEIGPRYVEAGMNFLITDYRGYGWSTGTPTASTLLDDAHTLYHFLGTWLKDQGYTDQLFIMGRSLGSACAIELASCYNDEIKGLIIDSGFAETLPLARSLGLDLEAMGIGEEETFNNGGKIESVTRPTFILHGQQDDLIPLWQAQKLHANCGARSKELQIVPGADHNSLIAVGGIYYFNAIKTFVDKVTGASDWRRRRKAYKEGR